MKTAITELKEQLDRVGIKLNSTLFEKYLEKEKQQIIDAIEYDTEESYTGTLTGEQYYTSTFKTNKETFK